MLQKVNQSITNPLTINAFIGSAVGDVTIDDTMTESDLFHIAETFKDLPTSHLITETLPTTSFVTGGGADVLQVAQPYAQNMIEAFDAIGTAPPTTTTTASDHDQAGQEALDHNDHYPRRSARSGHGERPQRLDGQ